MDLAERYVQLSLLGRDTFVAAVARGALVGRENPRPQRRLARGSEMGRLAALEASSSLAQLRRSWQILPLAKRPGGAFVDVITVGRTAQNDIQLEDMSVSRFHAFFRRRDGVWLVCDAGSSNGTTVGGAPLPPRSERMVESGTAVTFGTVELTFYLADALFDVLSSPRSV